MLERIDIVAMAATTKAMPARTNVVDSDDVIIRGGMRVMTNGDINARYGVDPGFGSIPTCPLSVDRYDVKVISGATREVPMFSTVCYIMARVSISRSIIPALA